MEAALGLLGHLDSPHRFVLNRQSVAQQRTRVLHWVAGCEHRFCLRYKLQSRAEHSHDPIDTVSCLTQSKKLGRTALKLSTAHFSHSNLKAR